ncbi:cell division protein FtsK [Saccharothrix sp. NRRL B-16348]|uniref:type VII secretion protein EccCa n=1 Tax=Saccharothrix sp. NRRL B-16348 TaxID=1415542 RepID=UPI0006AF6E79|nr:type VII secretion protein EccCa [Saccharothrix sp. NRRL B-16348]KOX13549.1 cell division protein FtsK [Saccharothrix sp. NRRL B-16348]
MTTRVVHRPTRVVRPLTAEDPLVMDSPPVLPEGKAASGIQTLIPMVGAGAAMTMMLFLRGSGFAALGAVVMVVALGAAGVFYFTQRGQATRKRRAQRERYLEYLEELREQLRGYEGELRERAVLLDPPTSHLLGVLRDPARLWERRRADVDFLRVRLGTGALPVRSVQMREQGSSTNPTDPFMRQQAQSLIRRFSATPGLPLRVGLDRAADVSVVGARREDVLGVARAMLTQVAAFHAPDDVTIAIITSPDREDDWAWAKWLPHLLDRRGVGQTGPIPLLVTELATVTALLADDLDDRADWAAQAYRHGGGSENARTRPRLLVVDDAFGEVSRTLTVPDPTTSLAMMGITVVHLVADRLHEPGDVSSRVTVDGDLLAVEDLSATPPVTVKGTLDHAPAAVVEGLARTVAPLRLSADSYDDGTGTPPADFTALLGLPDPAHMDVDSLWRPRSERDFLRVPLGVDTAGRPILLDLKESAQLGMGPHGLCVGATGSGKSELLRTLVLALATTHSPDHLCMVLVDYKGGATFAPFTRLPHVAGLITNLVSDETLVERAYESLDGEVLRRQQVLADAGKIDNITDYRRRRRELDEPEDMPPLPHLLVLIDEFGELLTVKPEFVDLFLRIGRIGRSIGVHLLLSSQRVEQGKLRGLEASLSYRIGLRTLSEIESRTILDTSDAFHLPSLPGTGYLKVDVTVYEKFKAAYVSGPPADGTEPELAPLLGPLIKSMPTFGEVRRPPETADVGSQLAGHAGGPTLLSTIVDQLTNTEERVPAIWLPPLPAAVTLDRIGDGIDITPHGVRLRSERQSEPGLRVPLGLLDDPAKQWQGMWEIDLTTGGGNLLILGGPGTGKSTALRTVALGLATTHTPTDVGIYGIDLLGNGLRPLIDLPHVGGVTGRDDRERVRRTVDEVHAMLVDRERLFTRHQFDTVEDLRAARDRGLPDAPACTEVVLLLDGYGQLVAEFEDLEGKVHDLLTRSGRYGIHVVATARRWNEVRNAQQNAFANRIELRLPDPAESSIDAKAARRLPVAQPGRALTTDKLHAQVALPRLDSVPDPVGSGLAEAATLVRSAWTGTLPPQVRVLPAVLPASDVADHPTKPGSVVLGRFEHDHTPVTLDLFGRDQHLLVLGDSGTGKTNLLHLVADGLTRRYTREELVFAVFDPRDSLSDAVPEQYSGGRATNVTTASQLTAAVCKELNERDPVARQPWMRVVLLIDDYDVLAASSTHPLGAFAPFLAAGREIGLHVVMTRRVSGASRGLYEPFTLGVHESGCLSLLMSGDPSEGRLLAGVRPVPLPVGRAQLIRPGGEVRFLQTAYLDRGGPTL